MIAEAEEILRQEKQWLLNQCDLIPDFDDDVMDQQKWLVFIYSPAHPRAGSAFLLIHALVKKEEEDVEKEIADHIPTQDHVIPSLPQHICRRIMTRADMLERLDQCNVVTIDPASNVRASSVPMMRAFREICEEEGFEQMLQNVLDRIAEVESLGRTREVEFKDLKDHDGKIRLKIEGGWKLVRLIDMYIGQLDVMNRFYGGYPLVTEMTAVGHAARTDFRPYVPR